MTLRELSQLYWLRREIDMDTERLAFLDEELEADRQRLRELERRFTSVSPAALDGMPRTPAGDSRAVEARAVMLADLRQELERKNSHRAELVFTIREKRARCIVKRKRLEEYIAGIPDSLLRMVFTYRFVDGMTWGRVSESLGVRTTEESVKKLCYRYLEEENRED